MKEEQSFLIGRLRSFKFAIYGAYILIRTEHSIMVQTSLSLLLIIAGFYFDISKTDWMFQVLAIGLVISIEGLNTAVEKIADFIHPDYHDKIGFIKDIAAGAVFFAAVAAMTIGLFIYLPHLLTR